MKIFTKTGQLAPFPNVTVVVSVNFDPTYLVLMQQNVEKTWLQESGPF